MRPGASRPGTRPFSSKGRLSATLSGFEKEALKKLRFGTELHIRIQFLACRRETALPVLFQNWQPSGSYSRLAMAK
jgi:hypothetical protein